MDAKAIIVSQILSKKLSQNDVNEIVEALKVKQYITNADFPDSPSSQTLKDFLISFWDYETSIYIKEKLLAGQTIRRTHAETSLSRCKRYIFPNLGNLLLCQIKQEHIKNLLFSLISVPQIVKEKKINLAPETVNQIIRCVTVPLRWAYKNGLIQDNVASGILTCHVKPKPRPILTDLQINKLFTTKWPHESYKLAHLIALCTGMRIGEVQALQLQDIQNDTIHIRHNWSKKEGLKCTKNGSSRSVKIPSFLQNLLLQQISKNPYGTPEAFVFFTENPKKPFNSRHWNEEFHIMLKFLCIQNPTSYSFHGWRHYFATVMADHTQERLVQLLTGHKSKMVFNQYASHQLDQTLTTLKNIQTSLFTPLVTKHL